MKRITAVQRYPSSTAQPAEIITAEPLAKIMAGPPVTALTDIDAIAITLLLTTTSQNRGVRVRARARKALNAAGWDLDEYPAHQSASRLVFNNGHIYIVNLTVRELAISQRLNLSQSAQTKKT